MKRTLIIIVAEILTKRKGERMTGRQLAELIVKTEREFVAKKIKKTGKTEKVLVFQLMSEIGAQYHAIKQYSIYKTRLRPCKYYYRQRKNGKNKKTLPIFTQEEVEQKA